MKAPFRRYLLRVALLTALLLPAVFLVFHYFLSKWYTPWLLLLPLLTALFSLTSFWVQLGSAGKTTGGFTRTSMAVTMARLFFYIAGALLFFLILPPHGVTLLLTWGVLYFLYTTLEVAGISRLLRQQNPPHRPPASAS